MRSQSLFVALFIACSTFVAAQPDFAGNHVYARRAEAALRARDAAADVNYYDTLIARAAEFDADDLFARDAEPKYDFLDVLMAQDDHFHYARSPGQSHSKPSGGGTNGGSKVDPKAPKYPKLKKCNLCGSMCKADQRTCTSDVYHKGATGVCLELTDRNEIVTTPGWLFGLSEVERERVRKGM
ncbi:MAG: hypothetical protein Q9187_005034 [Circinaria calcarea]